MDNSHTTWPHILHVIRNAIRGDMLEDHLGEHWIVIGIQDHMPPEDRRLLTLIPPEGDVYGSLEYVDLPHTHLDGWGLRQVTALWLETSRGATLVPMWESDDPYCVRFLDAEEVYTRAPSKNDVTIDERRPEAKSC
jgi:hypothetical protein